MTALQPVYRLTAVSQEVACQHMHIWGMLAEDVTCRHMTHVRHEAQVNVVQQPTEVNAAMKSIKIRH